MREEIIEKSLLEFQRHGIRKMTLQQLAARLGLSTKTFYKYFPDKEALIEASLETHYSALREQFAVIMQKPASPVVRLFSIWTGSAVLDFGTTHIFYEDLNYYYPALQDKVLKKTERKIGDAILQLINEGISKGYFRKEIDPAIVLEGSAAIYSMLTRSTRFQKFRKDPFVLAENTMGIYLRGMCTTKGLKDIQSNPALTSFISKNK